MAALWALAAGHLLAMLLMILPFSLLVTLVYWQRQIRIGASLLVIGFGVFRLLDRRHPRALARIKPSQLGLWSFAAAIAHGAGLMLVPIYLGLCRADGLDRGHEAASTLISANLGMAVLVSIVHSGAMIAAGGLSAWLVYRYLGLKFVSRSWFNLDATWAVDPRLGRRSLAGVLPCGLALKRGREGAPAGHRKAAIARLKSSAFSHPVLARGRREEPRVGNLAHTPALRSTGVRPSILMG